ncbi:MAG: DUF5686 and carboxypeptidase regulatory-like domain-containing protein [Dysgonamonadaceae bacterium]|jgi:hypothetical protein|nr:DUF5686 and carboxypeptidase regulatory-like domain-containing protein [Dysgonamonadaceae bacterium]
MKSDIMKFDHLKRTLIFIVLLLLSLPLQAQIQGIVIEKDTRLPIPFVSISYMLDGRTKVVIANKQGKFTIDDSNVETLQITCLGYTPKTIARPAQLSQPIRVEMEEQLITLGEVLITPQNNPAHHIIRQAIANKSQNDFEKYSEYTYRNYLKSVYELSFMTVDQTENDSMAYVSETIVQASKQGARNEEKIIANRTSGLETPIFGQAMYSLFHKAISFYNASIPIFGTNQPTDRMSNEYLTPLSNGSIGIYNFTLEGEYMHENETDTIFEISYYPKKNTNIRGLKGTLYISSDGYALTRVVAQPHEKQGMDFYFKQEYQKVDGKWFPCDLEQIVRLGEILFPIKKGMTVRPVFSLVSHISDVKYTVDQKLPNRLEQLYLDEDSIEYNRLRFDYLRPVPMTPRETAFYQETDSVLTEMRQSGMSLDFFLNLMTKLPDYKIPVGKIDIDLGRIISQNRYENTRIGLGLYTNERWLKHLSIGGYVGYGTRDKEWKYGGEIEWTLQKSHDLKLKYLYQNTLKEAGKNLSSNSYEWNSNYWRNLIAYRFDRVAEHKIEGNYQPFRSLQLQASISSKNMTPLYDYTYQGKPLSDYAADDLSFSLRYAVKETYSTLGKERMMLVTGNPVFSVSYTRGIDWLRTTSPIYNKLETTVDIQAYNGRIGQSNLRLAGGYIDRDLPYGLLFTGEGSRDRLISLLIPNTFQTLLPYEFLSDRYVHAFYSHNFGTLLLKTRHFSPELVVAYNAGWGKLSHPENHVIDFQQADRIYLEGGLIIKNIVRIPLPLFNFATFNLGFGGFYRHGYYRFPDWKDNVALKVAFSVTF